MPDPRRGAATWQTIQRTVLPLIAPGLVATAILGSILAWNEFLDALLFVHGPALFTPSIHGANHTTEHETLRGSPWASACRRRCRC